MKFVKLHQNGREILVNLYTVTEVYRKRKNDRSILYFNFVADSGDQAHVTVDESLDEIYAKANERNMKEINVETKPLTVGGDVSVNVRSTSNNTKQTHIGVNDSNDSELAPNMGFKRCGPNCEAPPLPAGHIHKPHYKNPNFKCNPSWYCTGGSRRTTGPWA